jgi:hypothetical protein
MLVKILKSIGGSGDYVAGSSRIFNLDPGMIVEVRDDVARGWCASGIASPEAVEAPMQVPETTRLERPQPAAVRRPGRPQPRTPERAVKPKNKKRGR